MTLPAALRVLLLVLLAASLLLPSTGSVPTSPDEPVRVDSAGAGLQGLLVQRDPPPLLVRTTETPPSADEVELLTGLAHRSPLLLALPDRLPALRLVGPDTPMRAGRTSAVRFVVRGQPGDTTAVRLVEAGGAIDSIRVVIGAGGEGHGAFRLRLSLAGWHEWRVETAAAAGGIGGWVAEADPLRVLVVAGPPTWETRFTARALEESGAEVALVQSLGRGLGIGEFPDSYDALRGYDVVFLLPGARLDAPRLQLLDRYVADDGGGVVVAGAGAALPVLGLADGGAAVDVVRAADAVWELPPEIAPLPAAAAESAVEGLRGVRPGTVTAASGPGGAALLVLRAHGRGRAAALQLRQTWRWRMESGRTEEHREFWRTLADWAASGLRSPLVLRLANTEGPVGSPVQVSLFGAPPGPLPYLTLTRPGGRVERLSTTPSPADPAAVRAEFLPVDTGVYLLSMANDLGPRVAFHATVEARPASQPSTADNRWARLALVAARSGGAAVPRDSVGPWLQRWRAEQGQRPVRAPWLHASLFALLVVIALAEWTLRRTRGLP